MSLTTPDEVKLANGLSKLSMSSADTNVGTNASGPTASVNAVNYDIPSGAQLAATEVSTLSSHRAKTRRSIQQDSLKGRKLTDEVGFKKPETDCESLGGDIEIDESIRTATEEESDVEASVSDYVKHLCSIERDYKIQCHHDSKAVLKEKPFQVPVYINADVDPFWKTYIVEYAIVEINTAAPGVLLYIVENKQVARIEVCSTPAENGNRSYTVDNILTHDVSRIFFSDAWPIQRYQRTCVHEFLHALGIKHEHQRSDASEHVKPNYDKTEKHKDQYHPGKHILGLTRFDPFSIMMYTEGQTANLQRTDTSDPGWRLKKKDECVHVMSELDKVGLNLLYPPCRNSAGDYKYEPEWNSDLGLYSCGRRVMVSHNRPFKMPYTSYCGRLHNPSNQNEESNVDEKIDQNKSSSQDEELQNNQEEKNNSSSQDMENNQDEKHTTVLQYGGPICPACRTLKRGDVKNVGDRRWIGWSGMIYCGRKFRKPIKDDEHDGHCGPDYGPPCPQCRKLLGIPLKIDN